jgi:hypothetical protein
MKEDAMPSVLSNSMAIGSKRAACRLPAATAAAACSVRRAVLIPTSKDWSANRFGIHA